MELPLRLVQGCVLFLLTQPASLRWRPGPQVLSLAHCFLSNRLCSSFSVTSTQVARQPRTGAALAGRRGAHVCASSSSGGCSSQAIRDAAVAGVCAEGGQQAADPA